MGYVVPLSEVRYSDRARFGLKAARLGELLLEGFPVPQGFCLTISAYELHLLGAQAEDLKATVEQRMFAQLRNRILQSDVPGELAPELLDHYQRMQPKAADVVAVRSSSTAEDLAGHSFAGLYETRLNVRGFEDLLLAVRQCWASYWSTESVVYRELAGVEHVRHGMSVFVQAMVEPTVAGVLFTANPLEQETETAVVELVDGIGESLVGGARRARRIVVRREDGTVVEDSEGERGRGLALLDRLMSLGAAVEERFGESQDIEWAVDRQGSIWLLQTRPITEKTSLALKPDTGWQRAYDEPFSTLGCDLAEQRHGRWIGAINELYGTRFQPEFQHASGWLYFRAPWRTPGRWLSRRMKLIQVVRWLRGAQVEEQYESRRAKHLERLEEIEADDLSALSTSELSSRFGDAVELYLNLQSWSYPAVELAKTSVALLQRLCGAWFRPENGIPYSDLLSGLDNTTVRRDLSLHRIGKQLAELLTETEIESLDETSLEAIRHRGTEGVQFRRALQSFLAEYGYIWADRYPRDPAWELNRDAMVDTISHLARSPRDLQITVSHRKRQRYEWVERAVAILSRSPFRSLRRPLFRKVLTMAERHFPRKEERNHDVYRSVMAIRTLAHEVGRRLASDGVIQSRLDTALMTTDEIAAALSDGYTRDWQSVVDQRRPERQMAIRQSRAANVSASAEGSDGPLTLVGEACSPGLSQGPACVVNGFDELQKVQPGDIVVCRNLRPAWSTVFIRAGGVVVETGSLLSHGATLAREYGVAAVMNVSDATSRVADGDSITVDGNIGMVTVEPRGALAEIRSVSA